MGVSCVAQLSAGKSQTSSDLMGRGALKLEAIIYVDNVFTQDISDLVLKLNKHDGPE